MKHLFKKGFIFCKQLICHRHKFILVQEIKLNRYLFTCCNKLMKHYLFRKIEHTEKDLEKLTELIETSNECLKKWNKYLFLYIRKIEFGKVNDMDLHEKTKGEEILSSEEEEKEPWNKTAPKIAQEKKFSFEKEEVTGGGPYSNFDNESSFSDECTNINAKTVEKLNSKPPKN